MTRLSGIRAALLLIALACGSLAYSTEMPQIDAPERKAVSVRASVAPVYRSEESRVLSAAKTASIFVATLAIAGIGLTYFFRRHTVSTDPERSIHILDKRVVTPGLLAVLIETDDQKILILQDKKSHSAIRLSNE